MITTYSFLGSTTSTALTAGGPNCVLASNLLNITNCPPNVDSRLIQSVSSVTATTAETLGVWTITPTTTASANSNLEIIQFIPALGHTIRIMLPYINAASGETATAVCNAWRASLLAQGVSAYLTGSGTTTFIITAVTGSPVFNVINLDTTNTITVTNTTPGVYAVNTYAALIAGGFTGTTGSANTVPLSGRTYTSWSWIWNQNATADTAGQNAPELRQHTVFVDDGDAAYAAFLISLITTINEMGFSGQTGGTQFFATTTGALGAVNLTQFQTQITTTGASTGTLAIGTEGLWKHIYQISGSNDFVLTVTGLPLGTTMTFADAGSSALMHYTNGKWIVVSAQAVVIA